MIAHVVTTEAQAIPVEHAPPGAGVLWSAFAGFQERALAASTDELLIGGAKGPGKTDVLLVKPLRQVHKSAYAAAFVRESFPELQRPLDRAHLLYERLPTAKRPAWNGDTHRFTWPSRAFVQFGYVAKLRDLKWMQGGNWSEVLYDEIGNQPDERVIDQIVSEIRCPDKSIRRQFTGSANPGFAGHPVMKRRYITPCGKRGERIAWRRVMMPDQSMEWRSVQFVPGRVTDNPIYANDRAYMAALMLLPDRMKRCLFDGDWDAATGVALDELEPEVHLVQPFTCPDHWPYVAGFDWGFAHNAVYMWGRVSDDGRVFVCDTIVRRLLRDWDLASTYLSLVPEGGLRRVQSGHDCWHEIRARGENAPQTADYFLKCGIHLTRANIDRVQGFGNMLQYFAWRETEFLPQRQPMVQFFDTPGNRWLIEEQLPTIVMNPLDPRDVLKVNADDETGAGGDDGYDCLRMLLAGRPLPAPSLIERLKFSAWDDEVLRREAEKFYRPTTTPTPQRRDGIIFGV